MSESIIIDGVNVAECEHFQLLYNSSDEVELYWCNKNVECKDICDCDYKQLQRLKAENEKLKKQYNCYSCDTCNGKEDYRNIKRHCENAIKSVHKYQQALEEIKSIAGNLYYKSIKEPVRREKAIYSIIDKVNEVLQDVES